MDYRSGWDALWVLDGTEPIPNATLVIRPVWAGLKSEHRIGTV